MKTRWFFVAGSIMIVLALMALPASAMAGQVNVLRVGPGEQYATIQEAVNAANQGSRILVYPKPGDYTEYVLVNKNNLQFIAQGTGVVVRPPDLMPGQDPANSSPGGFLIIADHVTIRGFNIGFGGGCRPAIEFRGSYNTLADNYIYQAQSCLGITAVLGRTPDGGAGYNTYERNTISHAETGIFLGSEAIDSLSTGDVVRDNIITQIVSWPIGIENSVGVLVSGNYIDGTSGGPCISVDALDGTTLPQGQHTIVKNTLQGCVVGISLNAGPGTVMTNNRIAENTIENCGANCVALYAGSGAMLTNNQISSNRISASFGANGIALQVEGGIVSGNLILDNIIFDNFLNGIFLWPGANDNRIFNNDVRTNNLAAVAGAAGITVAGDSNLIVGNIAQGNKVQDLLDLGQGNRWVNNTYGTKTP